MKIVDKDTILIGGRAVGGQQLEVNGSTLENALRMLDSHQPPAPQFKAGDIVERISGPLHTTTASQFLVLGGSIDELHDRKYGERGIAIRLTDGLTTWTVLGSSLRKVSRLRGL